jgi:hypothetical protein
MNDLMKSDDLGFNKAAVQQEETGLIQATEARAVAEVQASYVIAKKFPRNQHESYMAIIESCKRPFLAEQAMYAYPRSGSLVTGPSIRLAEVLAQCWGNIEFGIREISRSNGISIAEAYAIDLQTNARKPLIFHVPHTRDKKDKKTGIMTKVKLIDDRDIYEVVANMGARRLRNCILAIIPGDVQEAAINQCKKTMESGEVSLSDRIRMMVTKFDELGVKVEHLEKRLGHNLDATIPQEIVTLQSIYKGIKDGFSSREDFFDIGLAQKNADAEQEIDSLLAEKTKQPKKEPIKDDKKPS